jgi:hypothetical protein
VLNSGLWKSGVRVVNEITRWQCLDREYPVLHSSQFVIPLNCAYAADRR